MGLSSFRTCRSPSVATSCILRAAAVPLLAIGLRISTAGAPLTFSPDDPIEAVGEEADASSVRPREITHFRDALDAIRGVAIGPFGVRWTSTR